MFLLKLIKMLQQNKEIQSLLHFQWKYSPYTLYDISHARMGSIKYMKYISNVSRIFV